MRGDRYLTCFCSIIVACLGPLATAADMTIKGTRDYGAHGPKGPQNEHNIEALSLPLLYSLRSKHRSAQRNILGALERRRVLSVAHHPFIVGIDYAFQTPTMAIMCLDFVTGGDLQVRCTSMIHCSGTKKGPRVLLPYDSGPSSIPCGSAGQRGESWLTNLLAS